MCTEGGPDSAKARREAKRGPDSVLAAASAPRQGCGGGGQEKRARQQGFARVTKAACVAAADAKTVRWQDGKAQAGGTGGRYLLGENITAVAKPAVAKSGPLTLARGGDVV